MEPRTADFEDDHIKYQEATNSEDYEVLLQKINKSKKIFILGNGGMMDISSHGAADMSRLIPGKAFRSFNDAGYLTSNANDYGFENSFTHWLNATVIGIEDPAETLVIGLSCSGNSANIMNAFELCRSEEYDTFLISGVRSKKKPTTTKELCFGCKYFHTTEILTMKLFYDIVYKLGYHCPDIAGENARKGYDKAPGINTI